MTFVIGPIADDGTGVATSAAAPPRDGDSVGRRSLLGLYGQPFEPLPVVGYVVSVALVWLSLAPSALVAGGVGLVALLLAGFICVVPDLAPYLPTGLWGIANELAIGNTPASIVDPIVANVAIIVMACALSAGASGARSCRLGRGRAAPPFVGARRPDRCRSGAAA